MQGFLSIVIILLSFQRDFSTVASDTWHLIDSLSIESIIPSGEELVIAFNPSSEKLEVVSETDNLTELAQEALKKSPEWLKNELRDNFMKMDTILQNTYAQLILNSSDPYVDEVAFTVANISPEILSRMEFGPEVIRENAELLYQNDQYLDCH